MKNKVRRKQADQFPAQYKDSVSDTIKKIPWGGLAARASLEIFTAGTGFAVRLVGLPGGESLAGAITKPILKYTLGRFTHVYEMGEITLSEIFGRTIPNIRYRGVGEFWAKAHSDKLEPDMLIEIEGLLSPYGPLMPAHPMSRPGYTVQGWGAIGDLAADSTEEYDTQDGFIYGDRVIRLSTHRNNKYYAGLYDPYFGISNVALPLYVDRHALKTPSNDLRMLWRNPMDGGKAVKLKGRLREMPSFYSQFAKQLPAQYNNLKSYGLEVFEITPLDIPNGVTHMAVSVSWAKRREERMITHYFNVQDQSQFIAAESELEEERDRHNKSLLFNYDDFACFSRAWKHKIPEYNEWLKPWLKGSSLQP